MLRKRVTVSYLSNRPTLSSWPRKDTAVHVSLSSDSNVKQRRIRLSFRSRQKQVSSRLTGQDVNARRSSRNTGSRRPHRAASPSVGAVYAGGSDLSTDFLKIFAFLKNDWITGGFHRERLSPKALRVIAIVPYRGKAAFEPPSQGTSSPLGLR